MLVAARRAISVHAEMRWTATLRYSSSPTSSGYRRTAYGIFTAHFKQVSKSNAATQDPLSIYESKVEREQVRAAIPQLPEELREMIILREYEALSYQEIAVVLDCPPGTVMSRLARACARLLELLPAALMFPQAREKKRVRPARAQHEIRAHALANYVSGKQRDRIDFLPLRREYFVACPV